MTWKKSKEMSQRPYFQPQLHVGLVMADFLGFFAACMCNNVCQEVATASIEIAQLTYFVSFPG